MNIVVDWTGLAWILEEPSTWEKEEAKMHAAGAYELAAAGVGPEPEIPDPDPNKRALLRQAREWNKYFDVPTLRKLHACPTHEGRTKIVEWYKQRRSINEEIERTKAEIAREKANEKARGEREAAAQHKVQYEEAVIKLAAKTGTRKRDYSGMAKGKRTVKNSKDRKRIKDYFATLRDAGYTVRDAHSEIARQAANGNIGKNRLSDRYPDITPRTVRRIVESDD